MRLVLGKEHRDPAGEAPADEIAERPSSPVRMTWPDAVEQDRTWRQLCLNHTSLIESNEPFAEGDQQTEDQSAQRRNQAGDHLHDILRVLSQVMLGQDGTKEHAEQRTGEDLHANTIEAIAIGLIGSAIPRRREWCRPDGMR